VQYLSELALRDFIGLLYRYKVPMAVLQTQLTPLNEPWFKDPRAFWHKNVFGDPVDGSDDDESAFSIRWGVRPEMDYAA
jgi:hypothetical protein